VRAPPDSNHGQHALFNARSTVVRVLSTGPAAWHRNGDAGDLSVALQISFMAPALICESLRALAHDLVGTNRKNPPTTRHVTPP
jgi:hypothetical protein